MFRKDILFLVLKSFIFGGSVFVTLTDYVALARVDGLSMQPVLNPNSRKGDYILTNKLSVRSYSFKRGEIIVFVSPKDPNQQVVKRIIGLEGDVVSTLGYKSSFVRIPEGHCWVEGDHTGQTLDSNTYGPVAMGLIKAKASHIVWPPSRWQALEPNIPEGRRIY